VGEDLADAPGSSMVASSMRGRGAMAASVSSSSRGSKRRWLHQEAAVAGEPEAVLGDRRAEQAWMVDTPARLSLNSPRPIDQTTEPETGGAS
jgi:hypothetical protein